MAIITVTVRVSDKKATSIYRKRLFVHGRFVDYKHFLVDWEEFRKTEAMNVKTSLFRLSVGRTTIPFAPSPSPREKALRVDPSLVYVSLFSNHAKRAHSCSYVNTIKEGIMRILNEKNIDFRQNNLISLYIHNIAKFAPPQDFYSHLRQCLQRYVELGRSKEDYHTVRYTNFFNVLFPFDLAKWRNYNYAMNRFEHMYKLKGMQEFNAFLCHHYRIKNSLNIKDLRADLRDFRLMLQKFNFVDYIMKVEHANSKHQISRCRRLVRVLKWRSMQSQNYIIFLINQFGVKKLFNQLALFQQVYNTFPIQTPS